MWRLSPSFLTREPLQVALVGVGGTGGEMLTNLLNLHHALRAWGYGGLHVIAYDPDTVSEANIVRQRYQRSDIGLNKAEISIDRYNRAAQLNWQACPRAFDTHDGNLNWNLVVSCVDTRSARKDLHTYAHRDRFGHWGLWLDLGNNATSGQAILGTPRHARHALTHGLPCATLLHPEIMDASVEEDAPSCSAIEALTRQDLYVNKMVAVLGSQMLWQLFKTGEIAHHAVYFDLATYTVSSLAVPSKPKRTRKAKPAA